MIYLLFIIYYLSYNIVDYDKPYVDLTHYSTTYSETKNYRIYLPKSYKNKNSSFPVIYYLHGWGGRYFKDDNALLEYEKIGSLVSKYNVILVMLDGNIKESEPRPYNVGCPEHITSDVQMKDYFFEFISHIDSTFRTKADRYSRGIIGYSMGGFMSFYLAGKYPDLVSSAVNMTGSPEFFIGYPNWHTLYPIRYMFDNLKDVRLRQHNSSKGELSSLNREVMNGALWTGELDYEYWEFPGGHKVDNPGEVEVFDKAMNFTVKSFEKKKKLQAKWSHYDIYPNYSIWDYNIKSNNEGLGYTYLKNISNSGFGFYSNKWFPVSPSIDTLSAEIITPKLYRPNSKIEVVEYNRQNDVVIDSFYNVDKEGRLKFNLTGTGHEIGILDQKPALDLRIVGYSMPENRRLIRSGIDNKIRIELVNLGDENLIEDIYTLQIKSTQGSIVTSKESYRILPLLNRGQRFLESEEIDFICLKSPPNDGSPPCEKIQISIFKNESKFFDDYIDIMVDYQAPEFMEIVIDDGRLVKDSIFGKGNGDGTIDPGEEIMVYVNGQRTSLFYDDPNIEFSNEKQFMEALYAIWTGDGITRSSIIKISDQCPTPYKINVIAKYETKDFNPVVRRSHWGRIDLVIN